VPDDISQAEEINVQLLGAPYEQSFDATRATGSQDDPVMTCAGDRRDKTLWFRYRNPLLGIFEVVRITTVGSDYDTVLAVYSGSPGSLTSVVCNDNVGAAQHSSVDVSLWIGPTYYIEVASNGPTAGTLNLKMYICFLGICRPAGDATGEPVDASAPTVPEAFGMDQPRQEKGSMAVGGRIASGSGVAYTVPGQGAQRGAGEKMVLTYVPLKAPEEGPLRGATRVFGINVEVGGSSAVTLTKAATVEVQVDVREVPAGQRAWLYEWTPEGGWTLAEEQSYDEGSGRLTARADGPVVYGVMIGDGRR
jgi:hypothetical protein